jgi:hypothetical protein
MRAWFPDDNACLDYLDWLRWPNGATCPECGAVRGWTPAGRTWRCGRCRKLVSRTAGTIFQDTRTPLTVWFAAAWYMTADPGGVSASTMARLLDLGSYQTAWAMMHRFRTAMVRPGRDLLTGTVEVDETFVGGIQAGAGHGGRGLPGLDIVVIAVELLAPKGFGRVRMGIAPDASTPVLRAFLHENIETGSTVVTDGWQPYRAACRPRYTHTRLPVKGSGRQAHELLPAVHRVASLLKRWLLGTHQGGVQPEHLQAYLDEFTFRFNRRHSVARGMLFYRLLELAAAAPPVTYADLAVIHQAKKTYSPGYAGGPRASGPASLAQPVEHHPWRRAPTST